jgi:hypothetical protein
MCQPLAFPSRHSRWLSGCSGCDNPVFFKLESPNDAKRLLSGNTGFYQQSSTTSEVSAIGLDPIAMSLEMKSLAAHQNPEESVYERKNCDNS